MDMASMEYLYLDMVPTLGAREEFICFGSLPRTACLPMGMSTLS